MCLLHLAFVQIMCVPRSSSAARLFNVSVAGFPVDFGLLHIQMEGSERRGSVWKIRRVCGSSCS